MEEIKLKLKQLVDSDDEVNWKLVCEMIKGFDYDIKMYVRWLFIDKRKLLFDTHMEKQEIMWGKPLGLRFIPFIDPTIPYLEELNEYVLAKMIENDRRRSIE
tara:strand:+ start:312 stop:617 length:306 start_codon:yes stop_codon:yes gene_type:complete